MLRFTKMKANDSEDVLRLFKGFLPNFFLCLPNNLCVCMPPESLWMLLCICYQQQTIFTKTLGGRWGVSRQEDIWDRIYTVMFVHHLALAHMPVPPTLPPQGTTVWVVPPGRTPRTARPAGCAPPWHTAPLAVVGRRGARRAPSTRRWARRTPRHASRAAPAIIVPAAGTQGEPWSIVSAGRGSFGLIFKYKNI